MVAVVTVKLGVYGIFIAVGAVNLRMATTDESDVPAGGESSGTSWFTKKMYVFIAVLTIVNVFSTPYAGVGSWVGAVLGGVLVASAVKAVWLGVFGLWEKR